MSKMSAAIGEAYLLCVLSVISGVSGKDDAAVIFGGLAIVVVVRELMTGGTSEQ